MISPDVPGSRLTGPGLAELDEDPLDLVLRERQRTRRRSRRLRARAERRDVRVGEAGDDREARKSDRGAAGCSRYPHGSHPRARCRRDRASRRTISKRFLGAQVCAAMRGRERPNTKGPEPTSSLVARGAGLARQWAHDSAHHVAPPWRSDPRGSLAAYPHGGVAGGVRHRLHLGRRERQPPHIHAHRGHPHEDEHEEAREDERLAALGIARNGTAGFVLMKAPTSVISPSCMPA